MAAIPEHLRGRLEDPELFLALLDHSHTLSVAAGADVELDAVAASYIGQVLVAVPDERHLIEAVETDLSVTDRPPGGTRAGSSG